MTAMLKPDQLHLHRAWQLNTAAFSLLLCLTILGWALTENSVAIEGTFGAVVLAAMFTKFLLIFFIFMEMTASHIVWKLLGTSYIFVVTFIYFIFLI